MTILKTRCEFLLRIHFSDWFKGEVKAKGTPLIFTSSHIASNWTPDPHVTRVWFDVIRLLASCGSSARSHFAGCRTRITVACRTLIEQEGTEFFFSLGSLPGRSQGIKQRRNQEFEFPGKHTKRA